MEIDLGALFDVSSIRVFGVGDGVARSEHIRVYASQAAMTGQTYSQLNNSATVQRADIGALGASSASVNPDFLSYIPNSSQPSWLGTGEAG
jgi:hypothetical protein